MYFDHRLYLLSVSSCPPLMEITLRILESFLQASRSYLSKHIQVAVTVVLTDTLITAAPLTSLVMIDMIVSVSAEDLKIGSCTFEREKTVE